ncbi:alpha/beta fold hydrolase [Sphingobacterium sp. BIGb0165]|uniref:alpha/beta fold hydrolase n=1 Tax=Sphingobacterium sp. BIGb0165 TaxID=2940615 RepID=UPI0021689BFA|nr:alpha/beta hydrolase [Sphingobacterium sp. BIGb0165]MCS4226139.1 pimeloyl-ACP methyl ester carboxylesterase [Sphingobacterium sp. BIGb0165]
MKTRKAFGLIITLVFALLISCQQQTNNRTGSPENSSVAKTAIPSEAGYVDVNGLKMYYEVYGEGKPLVLLHGSYMTIPLNWSHTIPKFKGRKVIVAEMQGHGRTRDIARKISYEGMADDVSGLLKHLQIDSADILGYSMGGGVAFQLAIRHPEQVRRLIVLSGSYAHDGWWPDVEASYSSITADIFKGSPIEKQYDSLGNDPKHFPEFVKKVISIDLEPYDWSKEANKIKAPLFMAIGDADGIKYEHALALFRALGGGKMGDIHGLPKSRLAILPGTTHIGMMYRMDWLVPMIDDFLNSDLKTAAPTF